jgi:hypothetical protein
LPIPFARRGIPSRAGLFALLAARILALGFLPGPCGVLATILGLEIN